MESVNFGVVLDDNFYCTECDEENQKEMQKKDKSNEKESLNDKTEEEKIE